MIGNNVFGQEFLSPVDIVEGKIRKRVGEFLGLRDKINDMVNSLIFTVKDEAKKLLTKQKMLEVQLDNILDKIDEMKKGSWSFTDIGKVTAFGVILERHIREVNDVYNEFLKTGNISPKKSIPWKWVIAGVVGFWFIKKII